MKNLTIFPKIAFMLLSTYIGYMAFPSLIYAQTVCLTGYSCNIPTTPSSDPFPSTFANSVAIATTNTSPTTKTFLVADRQLFSGTGIIYQYNAQGVLSPTTIVPSTGIPAGSQFGYQIVVDKGVLVATTSPTNPSLQAGPVPQTAPSSVYIFRQNPNNVYQWTQEAYFTMNKIGPISVSLSNNILVVGDQAAQKVRVFYATPISNSIYYTWSEVTPQPITISGVASAASALGVSMNNFIFGNSVSTDGTRIVVTAIPNPLLYPGISITGTNGQGVVTSTVPGGIVFVYRVQTTNGAPISFTLEQSFTRPASLFGETVALNSYTSTEYIIVTSLLKVFVYQGTSNSNGSVTWNSGQTLPVQLPPIPSDYLNQTPQPYTINYAVSKNNLLSIDYNFIPGFGGTLNGDYEVVYQLNSGNWQQIGLLEPANTSLGVFFNSTAAIDNKGDIAYGFTSISGNGELENILSTQN